MKKFSFLLSLLLVFLYNGCSGTATSAPSPKKHVVDVKKEYYTGGMLRSEFLMYDKTGMNGLRKIYGYNGTLTSKAEIKNGVKHGDETIYDDKGRIRLVKPYVKGRIDGVATAYYENSLPMMTITYLKGVKHGPAIKYNRDGSVFEKKIFTHGRVTR
ncbi:MAG: toxin-antitoxin system YwqK family antitoxin [Sulfurovum sp.]